MTEKLAEPEALSMLRHRFGRTIEVWTAYTAFLKREVQIGPDKTCLDDDLVEQTTHTLNMVFYSFIYSLFEKSGVNFPEITQPLLAQLSPAAQEARAMVVEAEQSIHSELAKIRNNIGFHHGNSTKKHRVGYAAYSTFHPGIPILIMQGLRVFFREAAKSYESVESYKYPVEDDATESILEICRDLKRKIAEDGHGDLASMLFSIGQRLRTAAKPTFSLDD